MALNNFPVCLCLTGRTIAENLAALEPHRGKIDLVELRADCLDPSEKFHLRSFPEQAGMPCLLTVRRRADGGYFDDGEGVRLVMIAKALSYARQDARANFAYVDLENNFRMPAIEEACRTFGTRIIRSVHYTGDMPENLDEIWDSLTREEDEIPKLAVTPKDAGDLTRLLSWAKTLPAETEKLVIGMGPYGFPTRVLAERIGSHFTYTSVPAPGQPLAAPGQTTPEIFVDVYRGKDTSPDSDLYALLGGRSILNSRSPALHNTAFRGRGIDALVVPFPSESIESALGNMKILGARGAAITVPLKEDVLPYLSFQSTDVQRIGACNTLVWRESGWAGYNTDADGFQKSALEFLGKKDFSGIRATLVGSGGAAKSVALALHRGGATCVILNRTLAKARALARKYDFAYGSLDDKAIDLISQYSDFIIQATSVGMADSHEGDPLEFYEFDGHEQVFDLIYSPPQTPLLARAAAAGCRVMNGFQMLKYQAAGQFRLWMGEEPPNEYY